MNNEAKRFKTIPTRRPKSTISGNPGELSMAFLNPNVLHQKKQQTKQNNNEFTTVLYNPRNGYKVTINYYMKDENIMCTYIGDFNGTVILYKK